MLNSMKKMVRPLAPEPVLRLWRRRQFLEEQKAAQGKPLAKVFEEIYETDAWAKAEGVRRYSSGPGSLPEIAGAYENFLVGWFDARPELRVWVDVGCGDFQVAERILARLKNPPRYVGCDIAANVVAFNQEHFAREGVSFQQLDVTRDPLPDGDVVTIREVFQHLSNAAILEAIANLRARFKTAIVTESTPVEIGTPNVDLVSGYRTRDGHQSAVFLDLPPFSLKLLEKHDLARQGPDVMRTVVVQL